jgi:chromosome segregation ATPase
MPAENAIPVSLTGFTWTAAGAWASFFALFGLIVRQWVPLKKQRLDELRSVIDAQTQEITRQSARIDSLEKKIDEQRERYEALLAYERERSEAALAFERASHDAELGIQRHAARNAKQALRSFVDLMEVAPERFAVHADKIRQRMAEMDAEEVAETTAIRSAKIIRAGQMVGDEPPAAKATKERGQKP